MGKRLRMTLAVATALALVVPLTVSGCSAEPAAALAARHVPVKTVTTSFTTMANPAGRPIVTSVNVKDNATYGVAMPIVVTFGTSIPAANRADVERRLFVQSSPAQRGIWSWQSATQVMYRPQTYWQTGTSVTISTALDGMPVGSRPISGDHTTTFTIGKDLEYVVNAKPTCSRSRATARR